MHIYGIYEEHVVYRFFGEPAAEGLPAYRITWLPEGYEENDVYDGDEAYSVLYLKDDDIINAFVFEYFFAKNGNALGLLVNETEYDRSSVVINEVQADYYQALNPGETNNLVWISEGENIVFKINGFLDKSVMMHIAESVVLADSTK